MTSYHHRPAEAAEGNAPPASPQGKQFVKFTFYRVRDSLRAAPVAERAEAGEYLRALLDRSQ